MEPWSEDKENGLVHGVDMEEMRSPLAAFYGMLAGHFLLVLVAVFWSVSWTMQFGGEDSRTSPANGLLAGAAVLCGLVAMIALATGTLALVPGVGRMPFRMSAIALWGGVFFVLWLAVTTLLCKRPPTSELFLVPLWAFVEACALYVLAGNGWLGNRQTAALIALIAVALVVGLFCYVLHYRLDEHGRFVNGIVPYVGIVAVALAVDALLVFNRIFGTGMMR